MNGGGKITGSLAGFDVGIMDANTRSDGPNPYANYAVFRLKRALPGGSYVGFMGIDKRAGNTAPAFNQSGGVDTRVVLMKNLVLTGYAAQSRSPLVAGGQTSLGAGLDYKNSWLEFFAERRKIGPNFNPEVHDQRFGASASLALRVSFFMLQIHTAFCKLRNGKLRSARDSIVALTPMTTSWTCSLSESSRHLTSTKTSLFPLASIAGRGTN